MSEISLGYYQTFDCDLVDPLVSTKWSGFLDGLDNYLTWLNVTDDKRKIAELFHHAGREISMIYKSMPPNELVNDTTQSTLFLMLNQRISTKH
ncbi:unnamed protein product [Brachionus calyciflorus]|uniref:Uncharacterized protein n=1 Tax=Brachionus calyciflorus TaxID=104777 RepID=A0A814MGV3_9BILA|nr:unnamed protein product [Brachionus calyciflorus]